MFNNSDEDWINILKEDTGQKKIKEESKHEFDFLLTGDNKSRFFIDFLLNYCNLKNMNLLIVDLWLKSDFKDFQKLMINNYREIYKVDLNEISNKIDEYNEENEFSDFNEKVFNIDGIKIGPLLKV